MCEGGRYCDFPIGPYGPSSRLGSGTSECEGPDGYADTMPRPPVGRWEVVRRMPRRAARLGATAGAAGGGGGTGVRPEKPP